MDVDSELVGGQGAYVLVDESPSSISGRIVDDHHMVVCVVLLQNRIQVSLVPFLGLVVEGRHHDAERQFWVLADSPGFIIVGVFLLGQGAGLVERLAGEHVQLFCEF